MTAATVSDLKSLQLFLKSFRALRSVDGRPTADRLSNFLREIARLRRLGFTAPVSKKGEPPLDPTRLAEFAAKFRPLRDSAWREGSFVDFWNVAGVQSNEIRNAAVLAWLLAAGQTHGRGNTILAAWLRRLDPRALVPFLSSSAWGDEYSVVTESYPLGDTQNRVDVVLESARALMFIEVKVNASEGEHQIERYLALANAKARARAVPMDAGVIYLTPSWATSPVAQAPKQVIHATWTDFAHAIEDVVRTTNDLGFADRLLLQFANHVRKF